MEKTTVTTALVAIIAILAIGLLTLRSPSQSSQGEIPSGTNSITANVVASGVTDLAGVQFDVTYNPAVVQYTGTSEGQFLDNGDASAAMLLDTASPAAGRVGNIILLRIRQPGVDGTGTLAALHFTRVGAGDPAISLQNVLVSDSKGAALPTDSISILS